MKDSLNLFWFPVVADVVVVSFFAVILFLGFEVLINNVQAK